MGLIDKTPWQTFESRDATRTPTHSRPASAVCCTSNLRPWLGLFFFLVSRRSPLTRGFADMEKHRLQNDTILTDDAVAQLLAKEASDASIKYSSLGLEAFRSAKYGFPLP